MVAPINRISDKIAKFCQGLLTGLCLTAVFANSLHAEEIPTLISDDETETLLQQIVQPIFETADVAYDSNKIFIVNDSSLNAFVTNGNFLFIHTGTLIAADNTNQLTGIIAHETGHIAGGHIAKQKIYMDKIRTLSVASLIAAGAAAAATGRSDAAIAVMLGSQSSLFNAMTTHQMHEERSADESAVKYLRKLGQSPSGLLEFMKKIQHQNRLSGYEETPYFRTHPLSSERMNFFEESIKTASQNTKSPFDEQFQIVKAKLSAFLLPVERGWKMYPISLQTTNARYAHAILYYRQNKLNQSLKILNNLISEQPENPYFHELKGQFLFESGKTDDAAKSYRKALDLKPHAPDLLIGWAQAALESKQSKNLTTEIIAALNHAVSERPNLTAWLLLARAYDENNQKAYSLYAAAQYSLGLGNNQTAQKQIEQAEKSNPSESLKIKLNDLKNILKNK